MLSQGIPGVFTESPDQMVRRVCRELGTQEEHHRHQRRGPPLLPAQARSGEAESTHRRRPQGGREARGGGPDLDLGHRGRQAQDRRQGDLRPVGHAVLPRGSGYPKGTLFPWVVSDFSLIDAIESGIVKVPRVPVSDDSMQGDQPTYRDLWLRIREHLPRKGRKTEEVGEEPKLPAELQGAIQSLYGNYKKPATASGSRTPTPKARGLTPPVFIVVCNNTNVSKLVFNYISGWERTLPDGATVVGSRPAAALQQARTMRLESPAATRSWSIASSSNRAKG